MQLVSKSSTLYIRLKDDLPNIFWGVYMTFCLLMSFFFCETVFAQFGGKSGAPPGSVVSGEYETGGGNQAVDASSDLDTLSSSGNSVSQTGSSSNKDSGEFFVDKSATVANLRTGGKNLKFNRRERYFIQKFRLEFSSRQAIEREAGIDASWARTNIYLRDLTDELANIEQFNREVTDSVIAGIGHDLNIIERTIDNHIDEIIPKAEKSKSNLFFDNQPKMLPRSFSGLRAKIDALREKSEIVDFASKALQAMGHR